MTVSDRLYGHDRLYGAWNGWRWALRAAKRRRFVAALRELWRAYVLGYIGETCDDCGRDYLSWWADSDLYGRVTDRWPTPWSDGSGRAESAGGLFCLACFDRRARARGLRLVWEPKESRRG